jgi:MFS family permease
MPSALFPAVAVHRFGDASLVGYLYTAPAVGALLVSLLSGPLRHVRRQGLGVIVTASLWGAAITAFGFAHQLWLALLLLGLAGLGDQISAILRSVMLYRITPNELLGRVSGIEFMQVAAAPSIGNLEAGALASATSLRFSIVTGGVACVVGCALLALVLAPVADVSTLDAYLATTPGGLYAVLATAVDSGANTTFVLAVQVLRLFVMLLAAPVLAGWLVRGRTSTAAG